MIEELKRRGKQVKEHFNIALNIQIEYICNKNSVLTFAEFRFTTKNAKLAKIERKRPAKKNASSLEERVNKIENRIAKIDLIERQN